MNYKCEVYECNNEDISLVFQHLSEWLMENAVEIDQILILKDFDVLTEKSFWIGKIFYGVS